MCLCVYLNTIYYICLCRCVYNYNVTFLKDFLEKHSVAQLGGGIWAANWIILSYFRFRGPTSKMPLHTKGHYRQGAPTYKEPS